MQELLFKGQTLYMGQPVAGATAPATLLVSVPINPTMLPTLANSTMVNESGTNEPNIGALVSQGAYPYERPEIWNLKEILISNNSSAAAHLWLYTVPVNGTPGPMNCIVPGISYTGLTIEEIDEWMQPGDMLYAVHDGVTVAVTAAGAAQGATSIPCTALVNSIAAETEFILGGVAVTVAATAASGATAVTVQALPGAIAGNTVGYAPAITIKVSGRAANL
jgi:sulfur transfer complex TusBCD TusB component (DsrH family)